MGDIEMNFDGDSDETLDGWSRDIETILDNLLDNVNKLQEQHRQRYLQSQSLLIFFRIPLIILSSLNSVFSVGLTNYMEQNTVSTINCLISLICACISSVELFLNIHKTMEASLQSYHGYKLLGIKISSCRKLNREHRDKNSIGFLNECISEYKNLLEQSTVLLVDLDDKLLDYKAETTNVLFGSPKNTIK
jgi:hypothetical protein